MRDWGKKARGGATFFLGATKAPPSAKSWGGVSYMYRLYDLEDGLSGVRSLRGLLAMGGEALGHVIHVHGAKWAGQSLDLHNFPI